MGQGPSLEADDRPKTSPNSEFHQPTAMTSFQEMKPTPKTTHCWSPSEPTLVRHNFNKIARNDGTPPKSFAMSESLYRSMTMGRQAERRPRCTTAPERSSARTQPS